MQNDDIKKPNDSADLEKNDSKNTSSGMGNNPDDIKLTVKNKEVVTYVVVGLIILTVLWFMFGGNSSPKKATIQGQNAATVDDQNALNQANQKLKAHDQPDTPMALPPLSQAQIKHIDAMTSNSIATPNDDQAQQLLKARMNQPTLIYGPKTAQGDSAQAQSVSGLSGDDGYARFANSQSTSVSTVTGQFLKHPEWTIAQGEILHATLDFAINTDLPSVLRAVLSTPVYSYDGNQVLFPKGSRLIGQYSTQMGNGLASSRIFVVWNRVITPDGLSVMINSPSADELGRGGIASDDIERHLVAIFGGGILYTVLGGLSSTVGVNSQTQPNSANQFQAGVAQGFAQTSQQQLQSTQDIKSTLHAYQGKLIDVVVNHDLDLYSALAHKQAKSMEAS